MAEEIWKPAAVPGSVHQYLVSSQGRVKRQATSVEFLNALTGRINRRELPERILAQQISRRGGGYWIVSAQLGKGSKKLTLSVAPVICEAFHGPRPDGFHCAHLNGNSQDNRPENLAWATPAENEAHKVDHGTHNRGERHSMARLTEQQVAEIRATPKGYGTGTVLARKYGVSRTQISDIRNGKSWGSGMLGILEGCAG